MIANSDDETNFPHKILLTNRQITNLCKAFVNNSSTDIKLSKTQLYKTVKLERFLGRLSWSIIKNKSNINKKCIKPLAKSVLIPLELTAAASAADAGIREKILGMGNNTTTLKISNDEIDDISKIVKFLKDSGLLLKGVSETIQNEAKE